MGADVIVRFGADMSALNAGFDSAKAKGDETGKSVSSSMQDMGKGFTAVGAGMTAAVTVPLVAIGAFAVESASKIDGAFSTMAKATGLQGTQLQGLETSWKSVYSSVPVDAGTLTTVIDKLNNSLHLQGSAMTEAATSMVDYAKVTGTDAASDTDTFTKAIMGANAGLTAMHEPLMTVPQLTDMMTVGFQKTGVSVDQISSAFDKGTASMTAMGLSIPQQIAMLDQLTAAGVPARQLTTIINGIPAAAKAANESATTFWAHLVADAKEGGKYTDDETKLLGKQASAFTANAMSGKMDNDALVASITNSQGATQKAAEAMQTFGEKLQVFKQAAEVAFAPIGEAIIGMATQVLAMMQPILTIVEALTSKFGEMPGPLKDVVLIVGMIAAAIGPILLGVGQVMSMLPKIESGLKTIQGIPGMISQGMEMITGVMEGGLIPSIMEANVGFMGMELPLLPIIAIVAAIGIALALLYIYFKPFHDAVDEVVGWVKTLVGDLMSGNFSKFGDDLKSGIDNALNTIRTFDYGGAFKTAAAQAISAFSSIGPAIMNFFAPLTHMDWGGLFKGIVAQASQLTQVFLQAFRAVNWLQIFTLIFVTIKSFAQTMIKAFQAIDWSTIWNDAVKSLSSIDWGSVLSGIGQALLSNTQTSISGITSALSSIGSGLSGAFSALQNIDWGGLESGFLDAISGALDSITNFDWTGATDNLVTAIGSAIAGIGNFFASIDWGGLVTGFINAITGLFGGGGGGTGGGQAATKVSDGMSDGLSQGVTKAGPDILGKLGDVFVKLLTLLPTIFIKIGEGLVDAIAKVDWGSVGLAVLKALETTGTALLTWLETQDWGKIATTIWNAIETAIGVIVEWLISLPWATWATDLWNDLVSAIGGIVDWLKGLPWADWAHDLWNDIIQALAQFGSWLLQNAQTFITGLPGDITGAIAGFGAWLFTAASGFFGGLPGAITSAVSGLGAWMFSAASGFFGGIPGAIQTALTGLGDWMTSAAGGFFNTLKNYATTGHAAAGAYIKASPGGSLWTLGEGGEDELVVPKHLFSGVAPWVFGAIPGGAAVGNFAGSLASNLSQLSTRSVPTSAAQSPSAQSNITYQIFGQFDSETIKRDLLLMLQERDNYHKLGV